MRNKDAHHPRFPWAAMLIVVASALLPAFWAAAQDGGPDPTAEIASIVPRDTLLYVEIPKPAELWAELQATELRQAVRSSFYAELAVNFAAATADLLSKSLTDRSLGEVASRYKPEAAIAFCPRPPAGSKDPCWVAILAARENTAELHNLLNEHVDAALAARFPKLKVTTEKIAGRDVKLFTFSKKCVWGLAFVGDHVVFGQRPAVAWLLGSRRFIGGDTSFEAARAKLIPADRASIFCYTQITAAAGEDSYIYGTGTRIAGVLEVDGKFIRDEALLTGNLRLPAVGGKQPCRITAAFPQGCFLVNQISFASGSEMLGFFGIAEDMPAGEPVDKVFTGTGFVAGTAGPDGPGVILAAELAKPDGVAPLLEKMGFRKEEGGLESAVWRRAAIKAAVKGNFIYVARQEEINDLMKKLSAAPGAKIEYSPEFTQALKRLPETAHGHSHMSAQFMGKMACIGAMTHIEPVFAKLSPSVARACSTAEGVSIWSVSPCGYGIWLVSANIEAMTKKSEARSPQ